MISGGLCNHGEVLPGDREAPESEAEPHGVIAVERVLTADTDRKIAVIPVEVKQIPHVGSQV